MEPLLQKFLIFILIIHKKPSPLLPSQIVAQGVKGGEALTTGVTYEYQHPYFKWDGATDGANGSGVDGYYVYFGTNSSADPAIDGNYQNSNEYTVTTAMTAGDIYYLRLKVKDKLGNVSEANNYFSYRYWYISPPGTILQTSKNDFSSGINTSVDLSLDGSMKLKKEENGSWSTGNQ